ncbi:MAG TPA: 2,4'-dihydroxyacetophenone dioxygenase family protein [Stellaceae bacterium]|nr:2,4'-dihydroxyacetophenone dioxygenase family protein [Stellaceae bacterium]
MDKTDRDALQNAKFEDTYIHADGMPWTPFSEGIEIKVLRTSQETGAWTTLFRCAKGSAFARHEHLGAGEYLMLSGKMEVRGGVEKGGITAYPGDYGYEPNGMIHDSTCFPEESVFYFTNYGPIRFMDDADKTVFVLDWQAVAKIGAQSAKARAAE